jgi:1,4-dihydroxy-2-naphthoyl-CoA hydrolase
MKNMGINLEELNMLNKGTLMQVLDIKYLSAEEGTVTARMPVNESTFQPDKILHGGANLALAETVAGLGSALLVDIQEYSVRGAQVSANHVGTVSSGFVVATANIIHKGKNTHVWNIDIEDKSGNPISTCRITNIIVKK